MNVGQFLQLVQREIYDHPADGLVALQWLQNRYGQVLEKCPWNFLTKEATFSTVAAITAGTVTLTAGSATVSETTTNANGWSSAVEGRYFRRDGDSEFYPIDTFTNGAPDTLTLNRVYEGTSGTVLGYTIFQRYYSLATDCRTVLGMCVIDSPTPMLEVSQTEIDDGLVNRPTIGSPPTVWALTGRDSADSLRVEVYPIPDEAHGILYHYLQKTPTLGDQDTDIIPYVNYQLLRAGWLADYWGYRAAQTDAPATAFQFAQKFEVEYEMRCREMIAREAPNFPPQRMKFMPRFIRHRRSKFGRDRTNILLP